MSAINSTCPGNFFSKVLSLTSFALILIFANFSQVEAATLVVPAGGDFQAALNAAQCGDTIVLQAGATFLVTALEQPFVAKAKGQCTGTNADFITIQGSNVAALPESLKPLSRAQIAALNFPKLVTQVSTPALEFQAGSHHYRFLGIEITNDSTGDRLNNGLVFVGENSGSQLPITLANVPHDIEFDRCYVHAEGTDGTTSEYSTSVRGFSVSAKSLTIKHSRIAGFRIFWKPGQTNPLSSNAVLINRGPGPYTIVDNYLEAWFGTIFTGGGPQWVVNSANVAAGATTSQATLTNVVGTLPAVGDYIAFLAQGMTFPVGVFHGQPYEWGAAKVTAVSGNTITYGPQSTHNVQSAWGVGAGGTPLTAAPTSPGMAVWNGDRPKDILVEHNQFVKEPVSLASVYAQYGYGPKGHIELKVGLRTTINANTFEGYHLAFVITARNQSSQSEGGGKVVWSAIDDTVFTNNWVKPAPGDGHVFGIQLEDETITVTPGSNLRIENNLFESGTKFINVASTRNLQVIHNTFTGNSGTPTDTDQVVFAFGGPSENFLMRDNIFYNNNAGFNCQIPPGNQATCLPNMSVTKNVVIDNRTEAQKSFEGSLENRYPVGNFYPNVIADIRFQNPASGDWRLSTSSPFKGLGTGGSDPGVDLNALQAALGAINTTPTPTPTPTATPTPTPTATPTPSPSPTPTTNMAPTVTITGPADHSRYQEDTNLTITVAAADADGAIMRVDYYLNNSLMGSSNAAPHHFVWNDMPSGQFSLTAVAIDNSGANGRSTPINVVIRKSPNTVSTAKDLANSIVGDFNWDNSHYAGAADATTPGSAAVTADLASLMNQVHQAMDDFNAESTLFDPTGNAIRTQLQAADYFARADAALAQKSGPSPSLKAHLERIIGHLSITHDLMVFGSITPETAQFAAAVGARKDLVIGGLDSGYSPVARGSVAPGSIGSVFENIAPVSLGSQTIFANLGADQTWPYELAGVSVTVAGESVPVFYVSPTRVNFYVPTDLPAGGVSVIVVSQNGFVSVGTVAIVRNFTRVMTMIDDEAGPALAVNAMKQVRETFSVTTTENPGTDKRTRVMFFATGVSGSAANTDATNDLKLGATTIVNLAESVIVEARTSDGRVYQLPVEFAGAQGGFPGLDQINVVLIPQLQNAGSVGLTLIVNGQRSNPPTIVVR